MILKVLKESTIYAIFFNVLIPSLVAMSSDSPYVPSITDTAKRRERVDPSVLSDRTVASWPSLWREHGLDVEFMHNLVTASSRLSQATLLHKAMGFAGRSDDTLNNQIECIRDLISNGADIAAIDCDGETPLHKWASRSKNLRGSAVSQQEVTQVGTTLKESYLRGINFNNLKNNSGNTPMHIVCMQGLENEHLFSLFIDLGFDCRILNNQDQSILHILAKVCPCPQSDAIILRLRYLLNTENFYSDTLNEIREVVNVRDSSGNTALHYTCNGWGKRGRSFSLNFRLFELIISMPDCNVNSRDFSGRTPLFYAKRRARAGSDQTKFDAQRMCERLESLGATK